MLYLIFNTHQVCGPSAGTEAAYQPDSCGLPPRTPRNNLCQSSWEGPIFISLEGIFQTFSLVTHITHRTESVHLMLLSHIKYLISGRVYMVLLTAHRPEIMPHATGEVEQRCAAPHGCRAMAACRAAKIAAGGFEQAGNAALLPAIPCTSRCPPETDTASSPGIYQSCTSAAPHYPRSNGSEALAPALTNMSNASVHHLCSQSVSPTSSQKRIRYLFSMPQGAR